MKEFPTASMDKWTKVYTFIFVGIAFFTVYLLYNHSDFEKKFIFIPLIFLILVLVIAYALIPKITIINGTLYIKNKFTVIRIPVKEIEGIKRFPEIGMNLRLFGVGGIFGHFGYFNGGDLWYVTNIYKKVKIKTPKKLYIISPENPEKLIEEINLIRHKNL